MSNPFAPVQISSVSWTEIGTVVSGVITLQNLGVNYVKIRSGANQPADNIDEGWVVDNNLEPCKFTNYSVGDKIWAKIVGVSGIRVQEIQGAL